MLKIENIEKSYKKHEVLKGVDLHVKKGEIKALIGVNGAGKSTLIEIITGVKPCDAGEILIDGKDIKDKKLKGQIKSVLGYMPQTFCMFSDLTVKENLGYLCAVYDINESKIDEIMEICNLKNYKKVLVRNLSGGYKQLLSIAGAIIHTPKLLILDEPTSAMDPIFRKNFWKIIKRLNKNGTTILIITHYIEELLECDTFACLVGGKIKYDGKVSEFKKNNFINIEEILNKFESDK